MRSALFNNLFLLCFTLLELRCEASAQTRKAHFSRKIPKRDVSLNEMVGDYQSFRKILDPIAVKRVSGTPENVKVRDSIVNMMKGYGWSVDVLPFKDSTPFGVKNFANVVATYPIGRDFQYVTGGGGETLARSSVKNRVVFACHFDSKYYANYDFIGATDSAVPCAILVDMAKFLHENFDKNEFKNLYRHIQFVFFDGEEAFVEWSNADSTYGSRNLAGSLKKSYGNSAFESMDLFVLLDLIGGDNMRFLNYFPQSTSNVYTMLANIETYLRKMNMLSKKEAYYFSDTQGFGKFAGVEDDHLPFLRENVPILHLIPSPFPSVWHTRNDNVQNLNVNHVQDMRLIMKYFLLQILNVRI